MTTPLTSWWPALVAAGARALPIDGAAPTRPDGVDADPWGHLDLATPSLTADQRSVLVGADQPPVPRLGEPGAFR